LFINIEQQILLNTEYLGMDILSNIDLLKTAHSRHSAQFLL